MSMLNRPLEYVSGPSSGLTPGGILKMPALLTKLIRGWLVDQT